MKYLSYSVYGRLLVLRSLLFLRQKESPGTVLSGENRPYRREPSPVD